MEVFNSAIDATATQVKSLTSPTGHSHELLEDEKSENVAWPKYLLKETVRRFLSSPPRSSVFSSPPRSSVFALTPRYFDSHRFQSSFKQWWDLGLMLCIIYSALVVPFRIAFQAEAVGQLWVFEASMSLFFLTDLVLSFNTAYMHEGVWITSREQIAKRYLSGWFWIDAPSSVPVELIELAEKTLMHANPHGSSMLSAFRILRMLRLVRILRLLKLGVYISRIEEQLDMSLRGLKIVQLMLEIVFIAHMLACAWFSTTWLHAWHTPEEATWIDVYEGGDAADGPVSQQYLYSFYWALTVLSAQNPIPPTTDSERIFMVGVSLLNRLLFAYIVGKISSLIAALDRHAALVADKMDVIKEYLYWRSTPRDLAIRIKRYYEFFCTLVRARTHARTRALSSTRVRVCAPCRRREASGLRRERHPQQPLAVAALGARRVHLQRHPRKDPPLCQALPRVSGTHLPARQAPLIQPRRRHLHQRVQVRGPALPPRWVGRLFFGQYACTPHLPGGGGVRPPAPARARTRPHAAICSHPRRAPFCDD